MKDKKMLNIRVIWFTIFFVFVSCQSDDNSDISTPEYKSTPYITPTLYTIEPLDGDMDGDYIPDIVDKYPYDGDSNSDGVLDGLSGDPFFSYQWYIYSDSDKDICNTAHVETIKGNDLNILPLYHHSLGNNNGTQTIQVVDGGVDNHPDIIMDKNRSINSITHTNDSTPIEGFSTNPTQIFYRGHGTAIAGIIGARGFNGIGIRGVMPFVKIAGSNWLESEDLSLLADVWYSGNGANEITISNNSWGTKFINDFTYETIMQKASNELRDGKGRIFVFAGGNEKEEFSNANLSYLINNPYAIAVSAINHENKYASYTTGGSNILVSAYGGEHYYTAPTIFTTFTPSYSLTESELLDQTNEKNPITIDEDRDKNYTYSMNGSSASAPMVSGVLGLVLDMCPDLTWRDIRWIIAQSSDKIDETNSLWIENRAGLWHNNNYGFGRINPMGMTQICLSPLYKPLPKQTSTEIYQEYSQFIPDNNQSLSHTLHIKEDLHIDWVGITIDIDHPFAGDIVIDLVSPSGTISHIMDNNFLTFNAYDGGFRFSTVSLMGERSFGDWRVILRDSLTDDIGILKSIKIEIRGYEL